MSKVPSNLQRLESIQNPRVKAALDLRESRSRRQRQQFLIEGQRELSRAIAAGVVIKEVFISDRAPFDSELRGMIDSLAAGVLRFGVTERVYQKLALRETTEHVVAVAENANFTVEEFFARAQVLVVTDGLEKPGNIGAILRSIDGSGGGGILIASEVAVDYFNPNAVRASQGAIFSVPWLVRSPSVAADLIQSNGFETLALDPGAKKFYFDCDLHGKTALIVGNEAEGLTGFWRKQARHHIKIPMHGVSDSLNASVSVAVVLYEVARQRHFVSNTTQKSIT